MMDERKRKPHPGAMSHEMTGESAHEEHEENVGRVLSRREVLRLLGGTGAVLVMGGSFPALAQTRTPATTPAALPSCVARPSLTEGPYFVDGVLNRSDIRSDPTTSVVKEGALLKLAFIVTQIDGIMCAPFPDVQVDVWHCDATGAYSNFQSDTGESTVGEYFLRGYQLTDAFGQAAFTTIYPGWYQGRTVHIHFKMRTDPESEAGYEFTSQLFFDDALSDAVFTQEPYREKTGNRLRNDDDGIYGQSNGETLVAVTEDEDGNYTATFNIGLDLSQPSSSANDIGGGMGRGGMPPRGLPGSAPRATPTPAGS